MYNNPYYRPSLDNINSQIQELEKLKTQMQVQPPIMQNFQLAPTMNEMIKYVNSIEDVQKVFVIGDTPYFSKDLKTLWIKNAKGDIKSYEITEIVKRDEKDVKIEALEVEIEKLKKEMKQNEYDPNTNEDTTDVSSNGKSTTKSSKK